jgi:hypothetical protein
MFIPDPIFFHPGSELSSSRIRIQLIHMFLGHLDPDLSVRGMDPAPDPDLDPSITKQKSKKNYVSFWIVTFFEFLSWNVMYMYLQNVICKKSF